MKDVSGVVVVEKDWTDRKTDGMKDGQMHTQTDEGHFYIPLCLCRVKMNR